MFCKYILVVFFVLEVTVEGGPAALLLQPNFLRTESGAPDIVVPADSHGVLSAEPIPEVVQEPIPTEELPTAVTYQSRPPGQETALPLSLGAYIRNFVGILM